MTLKELLGDDYKDEMTVEEIETALADKTFVDPSTLPKSVTKDVFDKTASELAKVKKELKSLQEKSMTDEEKLQAEIEKAKETQANYAKELAKLTAKEIFVSAGLKEDDYSPILEVVVTEDSEITKSRAQSMVDLIVAQKEAVEKSVKAELLKSTKRPPGGAGGKTVTQKQFDEMGWRERTELKQKDPELFKQLSQIREE